MVLTARYLTYLVSVQPPMNEMPSHRFTVCPFASFSTNVSSRVFLVQRAISFRALSQEMSSHSVAPGRRTCGLGSRRGFSMSCSIEEPFVHIDPRLVCRSG